MSLVAMKRAQRARTGATEADTMSVLGGRHVHPAVRAGTKASMLMFLAGLGISALQASRQHAEHRKQLNVLKRLSEQAK